jgi:hypothetical protein
MSSEVKPNDENRLREESGRPTPIEVFTARLHELAEFVEAMHPPVYNERLWMGVNFIARADAVVDVVSTLPPVMVSNPEISSASTCPCPAVRRSTASCWQNAQTLRTSGEGVFVVEEFVASGMACAAEFIAGDAS